MTAEYVLVHALASILLCGVALTSYNYMLPHRKDPAFNSVPVSRVGLLTRLTQLNPAQSRPVSRPATPSAYVTSSLNPTRNLPVTSHSIRLKITTQEELEQFEQLPIARDLRKFEQTLTSLTQLVSSFKEDEIASDVAQLIDVSTDISRQVQVLQRHQELGAEIAALENEKLMLDQESKHLLRELISVRAELKKLPRLPAAPSRAASELLNEVSVQALLDYAMKLAKFSKAPATVMAQSIHPNNYIWPAEDALRRGMLAAASLQPDALVQAELGEPSEAEDVEMKEETVEEAEPEKREQRPQAAIPVAEAAPALDMDLFDEDESD